MYSIRNWKGTNAKFIYCAGAQHSQEDMRTAKYVVLKISIVFSISFPERIGCIKIKPAFKNGLKHN